MSANSETFTVGGPDIAWRETGGEIVILDLTGSVYFGLNSTGAQLWKRLLTGANRTQLLAELTGPANRYPARVETDIDAFLADLDQCGLLHRSPAA